MRMRSYDAPDDEPSQECGSLNRDKTVRMIGDVLYVNWKAQIWDGADVAGLREALKRIPNGESVILDMSTVLGPATGTFGALMDFVERGCTLILRQPTPAVQSMRWFTQFTAPAEGMGNHFQLYFSEAEAQKACEKAAQRVRNEVRSTRAKVKAI